jgi:hypothetical protein
VSTFPEYLVPQQITERDVKPANAVEARSGFSQRISRGAQFFEFDVVWPPYQLRNHRRLKAFIAARDGIVEPFEIVIPGMEPIGTAAGTPVLDGAHTKGATTIGSRGWYKNSRVLFAGDLIRIKQKVYTLTSGVRSNSSGQSNLKIHPGLYQDASDGEGVVARGMSFRVYLLTPSLETVYIQSASGILYQTRAVLREDAF